MADDDGARSHMVSLVNNVVVVGVVVDMVAVHNIVWPLWLLLFSFSKAPLPNNYFHP